ncbi:hypothetical protein TSAR_006252 [Trichomalopsis sarcophagae]|uniref:Uncharacterized protein n=1 Tax=Trichomalopsis sarcophagae TaxID=543379 RepID=A0A232EE13_9HYME|nr:hypothetical protein TSAR_006252 [Trichomalopsis sarcophagae]
MSKRKGGYKSWMDPNFKKSIPRSNNIRTNSEEDKEEITFNENRKAERKMNKTVSYLNERVHKKNTSNGEIILMWGVLSDIMNMISKLFDRDILQISKYKMLNFFPREKIGLHIIFIVLNVNTILVIVQNYLLSLLVFHKHNDNIEDIFDGDVYTRLSQPNNILFDDNKLPPRVRNDNIIILAGLWMNEKSPQLIYFYHL